MPTTIDTSGSGMVAHGSLIRRTLYGLDLPETQFDIYDYSPKILKRQFLVQIKRRSPEI